MCIRDRTLTAVNWVNANRQKQTPFWAKGIPQNKISQLYEIFPTAFKICKHYILFIVQTTSLPLDTGTAIEKI